MQHVQFKEAKANLSSLVDASLIGQGSIITRHGKAEAVLISYSEWQRVSNIPSFATLLMSAPLLEIDLQMRDNLPQRELTL